MSVEHYENFPVASLLLPSRLRPAVEAIYNFARQADDIADEGDAPASERLAALAGFRAGLDRIEAGLPPLSPLFRALQSAVLDHSLSLEP
ncbi:MAG: squalene/phytoene synthase family protein, partial [Lacisediminimonas sp.]|nr:squalene/phytoene synthase family protein [Lacisediminimonas sp.]